VSRWWFCLVLFQLPRLLLLLLLGVGRCRVGGFVFFVHGLVQFSLNLAAAAASEGRVLVHFR